MNVLVVDTSSWITYFDGGEMPHLDLALREGRVFLPPLVAAELFSTVLSATRKKDLLLLLKELPLCEVPLEHWIRVGELRAKALTRKIKLSTPDAHIAQCALDLDAYLLSEDAIFKKLAEITRLRI